MYVVYLWLFDRLFDMLLFVLVGLIPLITQCVCVWPNNTWMGIDRTHMYARTHRQKHTQTQSLSLRTLRLSFWWALIPPWSVHALVLIKCWPNVCWHICPIQRVPNLMLSQYKHQLTWAGWISRLQTLKESAGIFWKKGERMCEMVRFLKTWQMEWHHNV